MSESNSSLFNISVERTLLFKLEPKLPRVNSCKYHKKKPKQIAMDWGEWIDKCLQSRRWTLEISCEAPGKHGRKTFPYSISRVYLYPQTESH